MKIYIQMIMLRGGEVGPGKIENKMNGTQNVKYEVVNQFRKT